MQLHQDFCLFISFNRVIDNITLLRIRFQLISREQRVRAHTPPLPTFAPYLVSRHNIATIIGICVCIDLAFCLALFYQFACRINTCDVMWCHVMSWSVCLVFSSPLDVLILISVYCSFIFTNGHHHSSSVLYFVWSLAILLIMICMCVLFVHIYQWPFFDACFMYYIEADCWNSKVIDIFNNCVCIINSLCLDLGISNYTNFSIL